MRPLGSGRSARLAIVGMLTVMVPFVALPGQISNAAPTDRQFPAKTPVTIELCGENPAATPEADADHDHDAETTSQDLDVTVEFDQLYIDMMIPHHASIIAMAQVAVERLEDDRLRTMAQNIVAAQTDEIEELRGYRAELYGSADPNPLDDGLMAVMAEMMPDMGDMAHQEMQMNVDAQVEAICQAPDADLGFIDLTVPHHEMAIASSEIALAQARHAEIRAFAERVIADQQREIDELEQIRAELAGDATPVP